MRRFSILAAFVALLLTTLALHTLGSSIQRVSGNDSPFAGNVLVIPAVPQRASGIAVESQLSVEGCNAYPYSYYFADFSVVAGIIRNNTATNIAHPKVTITFQDEAGQPLSTISTTGLTSFVGAGESMGFRVQRSKSQVPESFASVSCMATGEVSSLQAYPLSVENLRASTTGARTLDAVVRSIIPAQGWAMLAVARDSSGRIVASASEVRGDTLTSSGTRISIALDRDIGEPTSVDLIVSAGAQPLATSTPAPFSATPTTIVSPTATSTATPPPTNTPAPTPTPGWTSVSTPLTTTLRSITLSSDSDGWAVGDNGSVLRLTAGQWMTVTSPTTEHLNAVHSVGSEFAIAVGEDSTVLTYTFSQFAPTQEWQTATLSPSLPAGLTLSAVTAISPGLQFIGDDTGNVYRVGDTTSPWVSLPGAVTGLASGPGNTLLASSANGVLYRLSAITTTVQPVFTHSQPLRSVAIVGNRVLVAGEAGFFASNDPAGPYTAVGSFSQHFNGVALSSSTNGWAVGENGVVAHISSGAVNIDKPTSSTLHSAGSKSPGVAWAVGDGGTSLRFLDASFPTSTPTAIPTPMWKAPVTPAAGINLYAVNAVSLTHILAAGEDGTVLQSTNGVTWTTQASAVTSTLRSIAPSITGTTYIAGNNNTMLTYHNAISTWVSVGAGLTTTTNLIGVSVSGSQGLALAAPNGANCCAVLSGTLWTLQPQTSTATYRAVALHDPTSGWLVGDSGAIGRWNNGTLSAHSAPGSGHLYAVSIAPSGKAVAVGEGGRIVTYHIEGSFANQWVQEQSPVGVTLNAVTLVSDDVGWAVGDNGTVLRLVNGFWQVDDGFYPTSEHLRGVTALPNGAVWVVGDNGLIFYRQPNSPVTFKTRLVASGW